MGLPMTGNCANLMDMYVGDGQIQRLTCSIGLDRTCAGQIVLQDIRHKKSVRAAVRASA